MSPEPRHASFEWLADATPYARRRPTPAQSVGRHSGRKPTISRLAWISCQAGAREAPDRDGRVSGKEKGYDFETRHCATCDAAALGARLSHTGSAVQKDG